MEKNRRAQKRLKQLQAMLPEQRQKELRRLSAIWRREIWRRVRQSQANAFEMVKQAEPYGLGNEMFGEFLQAVRRCLSGPQFESCSLVWSSRRNHPDVVATIQRVYGISPAKNIE